MKQLVAVLLFAALSACAALEQVAAPVIQPPSRVADDFVAPPGAIPVLVYRPEDEMAVCTNKVTRRTMPFAVCGGAAVANDPPGTHQVPMMIYRRANAAHYCVNFLNMEILPPWRCT